MLRHAQQGAHLLDVRKGLAFQVRPSLSLEPESGSQVIFHRVGPIRSPSDKSTTLDEVLTWARARTPSPRHTAVGVCCGVTEGRALRDPSQCRVVVSWSIGVVLAVSPSPVFSLFPRPLLDGISIIARFARHAPFPPQPLEPLFCSFCYLNSRSGRNLDNPHAAVVAAARELDRRPLNLGAEGERRDGEDVRDSVGIGQLRFGRGIESKREATYEESRASQGVQTAGSEKGEVKRWI
jgi:hypothetical protein